MALEGGLYTSRKKGISQATFDLPYRVYTSQVYPTKAPNGSTVIVTGHSIGVTVIWRGGRQFKDQSGLRFRNQDSESDSDEFESEEEDTRFSTAFQQHIVHRQDIPLNVAVTSLSLCSLPPVRNTPLIFIAAVCSDNKVRLLKLPLSATSSKNECESSNMPTATIPSRGKPVSVSLTWTGKEDKELEKICNRLAADFDLLVAICSDGAFGKLTVTRIPADFKFDNFTPFHSQILRSPARKVSFCPCTYPSTSHAEIMVCYPSGSVSIFDPFTKPKTGLSSAWDDSSLGAWLVTLTTSFASPSEVDINTPTLIDYQQILDAEWTAGGRGIIALLVNGQWGIWDRSTPAGESVTSYSCDKSFVLTGYLTSSRSATSQNPIPLGPKKARGSRSSLAPMTPQTRGAKSDFLFRGRDEEIITIPPKGGLSVTPHPSASGESTDEYVNLWYNENIYTIPSLRTIRTKKTGSLFGPGLTKVVGFQPLGQNVIGASVIPASNENTKSKSKMSSFESTSKHFDILVATETRLHFLVNEPSRVEIANAMEQKLKESAKEDRLLLARGALDLGGMDRMLNSMANSITLGKERERERREDSVVVIASPIKKLGWGENEVREFGKGERLLKTP